jgi:hypothetical protein
MNLGHARPLATGGVALVAVAAFALRYAIVLRYPTPPGADGGYYLANVHAFLGSDVAGDGVGYPPVFLAYLWGLTSVVGDLPGLMVSGALLAGLLAVPAFLFLRTFFDPPLALIGSAALSFGEVYSEAIGWGGGPTLLGILFGLVFLAFFIRWIRDGRRRDLVAAAASLGLLAGTHPFSLAFFAFAASLPVAAFALRRHTRRWAARGAVGVALGAAASLPFAPFYAGLLVDAPHLVPGQPIGLSANDLAFIFAYLFRETLWLWTLFLPAAAAGVVLSARRTPLLSAFGSSLLAAPFVLTLTVFVLHPIRPFLHLPIGMILGVLALLHLSTTPAAPRRTRSAVPRFVAIGTLALAVALVLVPAASRRMVDADDWYNVLGAEGLEALDWIRGNVPEGAAVGTTGPAKYGSDEHVGWLWGWWIEGYARRRTLSTAQLLSLVWESQVARAEDANRAFMGAHSMENGYALVGDSAPGSGLGNPMMSVRTRHGYEYEPLLSFDDHEVEVRWRTPDGAQRSDRLADLPVRAATLSVGGALAVIEAVASSDGLTVRRTVELLEGSRTGWVNVTVSTSGTLEGLAITVRAASRSEFGSPDPSGLRLSVQRTSWRGVTATLRVQAADGVLPAAAPMAEDPRSTATFSFSGGGPEARVSFALDTLESESAGFSGVHGYRAESIFDRYDVRFMLVDKGRAREMEWFSSDDLRYRLAFENSRIALFERVA